MSFDVQQFYKLLPAIHRIRDSELGEQLAAAAGRPGEGDSYRPLRQLIEVLAAQATVLEENLDQLYDNHFVETAAPWALPYIGDLLGLRGLSGGGRLTRAPRTEVGGTIGYRRRKGTPSTLEEIARATTGWPARAVEFFERLAATQHVNHVRLHCRAFLSVRNAAALEFVGSAFEPAARTVEVRRIAPGHGKWNIPNVGLFVHRLRAWPLTDSPLVEAAVPADQRHFRFHPRGCDVALFNRPETEGEATHLAEPRNVPLPITRRLLAGEPWQPVVGAPLPPLTKRQFHPSANYYGKDRSIALTGEIGGVFRTLTTDDILVSDLGDVLDGGGNVTAWAHEAFSLPAMSGKVLLDPMRGRVVFPAPQTATPIGSFYYGFSAGIGGGEYDRSRSLTEAGALPVVPVGAGGFATIAAALASLPVGGGIVEIRDSGRYVENLPLIVANGRRVELRAADGRRPTVFFSTLLQLDGDDDGSITLDGLLISGAAIEAIGKLGILKLRHCTAVPGAVVDQFGQLILSGAPALTIKAPGCSVEIESCIAGPLRIEEHVRMSVRNSIIDAAGLTGVAFAGLDHKSPAGVWRIEDCTIIGKAQFATLELASNSIFLAALSAADAPADWPAPIVTQRRQEGCVRFCWLPRGARVPRRYECLPREGGPQVRPIFSSLHYTDAAYAQLSRLTPEAIRRGADDESEMGAFHDLTEPQREAHLRMRLDDYLRFGLEAGIFFAT
jgi:hypothetical protein